MPLVEDGQHAVRSEAVSAVIKPDQPWMWYLTVYMASGASAELRFASESDRDDFYKKLVSEMAT